jgi:hypothetical protein
MKRVLCSVVVLLFAVVASAQEMKTVTISNEGAAVLTISAPQSAKVKTEQEKTVIDTKDMELDLWVVPKAKTVAEAITGLDDVIKSEVLKFTAASTEPITVAGRRSGPGHGRRGRLHGRKDGGGRLCAW